MIGRQALKLGSTENQAGWTSCNPPRLFPSPRGSFLRLSLRGVEGSVRNRRAVSVSVRRGGADGRLQAPQHFLNFFPLPHGHGSLRPVFCLVTLVAATLRFASLRSSVASPLRPCSSQTSASRSSISRRSLTWSTASPSRRICSARCQSFNLVRVNP